MTPRRRRFVWVSVNSWLKKATRYNTVIVSSFSVFLECDEMSDFEDLCEAKTILNVKRQKEVGRTIELFLTLNLQAWLDSIFLRWRVKRIIGGWNEWRLNRSRWALGARLNCCINFSLFVRRENWNSSLFKQVILNIPWFKRLQRESKYCAVSWVPWVLLLVTF